MAFLPALCSLAAGSPLRLPDNPPFSVDSAPPRTEDWLVAPQETDVEPIDPSPEAFKIVTGLGDNHFGPSREAVDWLPSRLLASDASAGAGDMDGSADGTLALCGLGLILFAVIPRPGRDMRRTRSYAPAPRSLAALARR